MIVADTSFAIEYLLQSALVQDHMSALSDETIHAPSLIDVEAASALRKLARTGHISESRANFLFQALSIWPITRHDYRVLLPRAWELRHSITPYDATFVALAEHLDAPLWTFDARLSRSQGHRARIVLLS